MDLFCFPFNSYRFSSVYRVLPRFVVQQDIRLGDTQVTNDTREVIHINPGVKHLNVARLSDIHISPQPIFNVAAYFSLQLLLASPERMAAHGSPLRQEASGFGLYLCP